MLNFEENRGERLAAHGPVLVATGRKPPIHSDDLTG